MRRDSCSLACQEMTALVIDTEPDVVEPIVTGLGKIGIAARSTVDPDEARLFIGEVKPDILIASTRFRIPYSSKSYRTPFSLARFVNRKVMVVALTPDGAPPPHRACRSAEYWFALGAVSDIVTACQTIVKMSAR